MGEPLPWGGSAVGTEGCASSCDIWVGGRHFLTGTGTKGDRQVLYPSLMAILHREVERVRFS